MFPLRSLLCLFLVCSSGQAFAYTPEEGNINAILGPYFFRTDYPGRPEVDSPNRSGYGISALGDSNSRGSIELGFFYLEKIFFRDQGPDILAEKIKHIHITMGYRWWLKSYLSTSLSFFSAYPLGDPELYYSNVRTGIELDTSARDLTEYGFDFAVQGELVSYQQMALVLEGRYSWSVTPKQDEKANHYGVLLGVRFMVQDRMTAAEAKKRREKPEGMPNK